MNTSRKTSRWSHLREGLAPLQGSLFCFSILVFWDVVITGSFLFSLLICPIWFVVAVVLVIVRRPNWVVALTRIQMPLFTLVLVFANNSLQTRVARINAARVVEACEQYHEANGTYPESLDELVPRYLSSVPRAKYCLSWGEIRYWGPPINFLDWVEVPPFGRRTYAFERGEWGYLD